jgi:CheY-like chemotaxis protein
MAVQSRIYCIRWVGEMSKPTVLCVDDRADSLLIRKRLLEQFGCNVVVVYDFSSCVAALNENRIDLVVIDYHLGEATNGETLARHIRKAHPQLPLIMLSGDPSIPASARESVDAVLIKGAGSPKDLLDLIQDLVLEATLRARPDPILPGTSPKTS